jgi:hypothetical protein
MNLQLHHVISDITGKTGLDILDAILAGERDPQALAKLRDRRIKASEATIQKALSGAYRAEHLFTLRQALQSYRHYQGLIFECDREIERLLEQMDDCDPMPGGPMPMQSESEGSVPAAPQPAQTPDTPTALASVAEPADPQEELIRILGVDLTAIPGLHVASVRTLFSEIGRDLSAFKSAKHFASWLGLCPDNRVSGGNVLGVGTRRVKQRAATVLRMAAQSLHRSPTALGDYYRRMRARLGAPQAITATAHKLARVVYHLMTTGQAYEEAVFARADARVQERRIQRLHRDAAALGFTLHTTAEPSVS